MKIIPTLRIPDDVEGEGEGGGAFFCKLGGGGGLTLQ